MITAKHDPTRATSLMEDLREFRKEASNGELSIQIEDLGEVLKLIRTIQILKKITRQTRSSRSSSASKGGQHSTKTPLEAGQPDPVALRKTLEVEVIMEPDLALCSPAALCFSFWYILIPKTNSIKLWLVIKWQLSPKPPFNHA